MAKNWVNWQPTIVLKIAKNWQKALAIDSIQLHWKYPINKW